MPSDADLRNLTQAVKSLDSHVYELGKLVIALNTNLIEFAKILKEKKGQ